MLVDGVQLAPDAKSVTGRFVLVAADGSVILECRSCTIRWIESGIDSVVAASATASGALRITDEEAADIAAVESGQMPSLFAALISRLISELTGIEVTEIAASDTTSELGIDSIQATRLYRALEPINPRSGVTLADIVQGISVADLAMCLTAERAASPARSVSVTGHASGGDSRPAFAGMSAVSTVSGSAIGTQPVTGTVAIESQPVTDFGTGAGSLSSTGIGLETVVPQRSTKSSKPYFVARDPAAKLRLLCVPYGGGSTLLFHGWQRTAPPGVEVCPVALPGHGARLDEPLVSDVHRIVAELETEVVRHGDSPFALYGHSAGALISYLLAARLRANGHQGPRCLYLAAFSSPASGGNPFYLDCREELQAAGYSDLPAAEHIREMTPTQLQCLATALRFPDATAADPALLRIALPILANDIRMVGSFRHGDATVLDVPIVALHGRRDDRVTEQQVRDWAHWTTAPFQSHVFDGDHYFLHPEQCRDQVLEIIAKGTQ